MYCCKSYNVLLHLWFEGRSMNTVYFECRWGLYFFFYLFIIFFNAVTPFIWHVCLFLTIWPGISELYTCFSSRYVSQGNGATVLEKADVYVGFFFGSSKSLFSVKWFICFFYWHKTIKSDCFLWFCYFGLMT